MGFFDKVKKAFGSKKEDIESQNSDENIVNSEIIDKSEPNESLKNDDESLNDNEEIQSNNSEETPTNEEVNDKPKPTNQIRSFKNLDDLIHSGAKEIVLDSDIVLGDGEESEYKDGIKLDVDGLVIDGNGYEVDACGKTRIFYCMVKNITIKNITLKNGSSRWDSGAKGGAIFNSDDCSLTISKSILNENESYYGGAIYNMGKLCISKSTLNGNQANDGGAVYNVGELCISESALNENKAKMGGAIWGSSIVKNSLLGDNSAESGGAIFAYGTSNILNSTFSCNNASYHGGAICNGNLLSNSSADLNVYNSVFYGNCAKVGGAINNNKVSSIKETIFENNKSQYEYCDDIQNNRHLMISKITFKNQSKSISSIYKVHVTQPMADKIHTQNGRVYEIENSEGQGDFTYLNDLMHSGDNEIKLDRDIVFNHEKDSIDGISIDFDNLIIDGNGHTVDAQGFTRIFDIAGKNIVIKNMVLKNGFSDYDGGAIRNRRDGELTVLDCVLSGNFAWGDGGGIYNENILNVKDSLILDNTARDGAVIYNSGGGTITSCNISNNRSNSIITNEENLEIHNTSFNSNKSKCLIVNQDKGSTGIFHAEFVNNAVEGALINNVGNFLTIQNNAFENNVFESEEAKCIYNKSDLILIDLIIKNDDGIIFNEGHLLIKNPLQSIESKIEGKGIVEIDEDLISHDRKFDFGYLDEKIHKSTTKMIILEEDISFENYEKDYYEGGIYLDEDDLVIDGNGKTIDARHMSRFFIISGRNITLKNITFKNGCLFHNFHNSLNNHGAALRINSKSSVKIEHCEFINNFSEENAGVISNKGNLNISDSNFKDNHAEDGGGTIYNQGKSCIHDSTFSNNHGGGNGGAIYNLGLLQIKYCDLSSNSSKEGGAIYNEGNLIILESDLSLNDIKRYCGGAISSYGGKLLIEKSILSKNFATYDDNSKGGAIYISGGHLKIVDSSLLGNEAKCEGGAICISQGISSDTETIILNCNLSDNHVKGNGGAITNDDGGLVDIECSLHIENSILSKNNAYYYGGTISNGGKLKIVSSLLSDNKASEGGSIYNQISGELNIISSELSDNVSTNGNGGAVKTANDDIKLKDCLFKHNEPDDVFEE